MTGIVVIRGALTVGNGGGLGIRGGIKGGILSEGIVAGGDGILGGFTGGGVTTSVGGIWKSMGGGFGITIGGSGKGGVGSIGGGLGILFKGVTIGDNVILGNLSITTGGMVLFRVLAVVRPIGGFPVTV